MNAELVRTLYQSSLTLTIISGGTLVVINRWYGETFFMWVLLIISSAAIGFLLASWLLLFSLLSESNLKMWQVVPILLIMFGFFSIGLGWFFVTVKFVKLWILT